MNKKFLFKATSLTLLTLIISVVASTFLGVHNIPLAHSAGSSLDQEYWPDTCDDWYKSSSTNHIYQYFTPTVDKITKASVKIKATENTEIFIAIAEMGENTKATKLITVGSVDQSSQTASVEYDTPATVTPNIDKFYTVMIGLSVNDVFDPNKWVSWCYSDPGNYDGGAANSTNSSYDFHFRTYGYDSSDSDNGAVTPPQLDPDDIKQPTLTDGSPITSWQQVVKRFVQFLLVAAGVIAVICIIIAGYIYMTSGGDPEKAKIGKNALIGAVIGLVIAFMAYSLINFVLTDFLGTTGTPTNGAPTCPVGLIDCDTECTETCCECPPKCNKDVAQQGETCGGGTAPEYIPCHAECPEEAEYCICGNWNAPCVKDFVQPEESCGGEAEYGCENDDDCSENQTCTEIPPNTDKWWCVEW